VPDGWLYREIERRPQEMGWFARTGGDLANATAAKYYLITGDKWGLERLQTKVRVENATLRYTKGSSR
jgi:hypothetical protein